jgi:Xaa-Pro aminopeptidase
VETLHTVLNRGRSTWDSTRIPESEFRSRLERVREGMDRNGVDLLLVYGDSWKYGHLAYLTHFIPKNRGALALIPASGEPVLVVQEPSRNNPFSSTLSWIEEVHSVGKFAQGLSAALKSRGLKPKRVGLVAVEEQLNIREWRELSEMFQEIGTFAMADHLEAVRRIKSPVEVSLISETARILEAALERFEQTARPGLNEYEAMAEMERVARRRGVEDFRLLLARSSSPASGLRPPAHAVFGRDEAVLVLIAASYQRYWCELGETFFLGRPGDEILSGYQAASQVFERMASALKGGALSQGADTWLAGLTSRAARDSIEAYGLGNGVGLDLSESPYLGQGRAGALQTGEVLTLRACMTAGNESAALVSRPWRVEGAGARPLSVRSPRVIPLG